MAIRPAADEIIRGVQHSIGAQLIPELAAPYAVAQAGYAAHVLSAVLAQVDGAAQQLADDNAALRALCMEAATMVTARDAGLAGSLRQAAQQHDADIRLSTLAAANDRLRALAAQLAPLAAGDDAVPGLMPILLDALEASSGRRMTGSL